jgi:hypothetical protein
MLRPSLLLLSLALLGCAATVRPPEVEVRAAPIEVRVGGGGGGFCPPGQAKKGRC